MYPNWSIPSPFYIYSGDVIPLSLPTSPHMWSDLAADKKRRQQEAIPKKWLIAHPPETTLNVTGLPETYGLLTSKELAITNEDVDILLKKLAGGEWSAVEVTTAFYKRAIIAQQLVNFFVVVVCRRG